MMRTRSELLEEGRRIFKVLAADGSPIRAFSEASRESLREPDEPVVVADAEAEARAFDAGLDHAVARVGAIADRISGKKR
jgi:hypothetical protein